MKKIRVEGGFLRWAAGLVFLGGFLFFLISACGQKKPSQAQNRPPELLLVPNQTNRSLDENQTVAFGLIATDPEGSTPSLYARGLPKNASFTDSANGRGSFAWTPTFSQEGNYLFSFVASDGVLADTVRLAVSVGNVNRPPFLVIQDTLFFLEGTSRDYPVQGIDPDGDSLFLSADSIPAGAVFTASPNSPGSLTWAPDFGQAGAYRTFFSATDRSLSSTKLVFLRVDDSDRLPVFVSFPDSQRVAEGQILSFSVSASDLDGDPVSLSPNSTTPLPTGAVFADSGGGRGGFFWQTKVLQADTFHDTAVGLVAASRSLTTAIRVPIEVDTALLTYTGHTKAIFDTKCTPCHFPGGQMCPPYCWNTYSTIFQFRELIRIRVIQGTMPPTGGLPQGMRDTINAWVLRGAPP